MSFLDTANTTTYHLDLAYQVVKDYSDEDMLPIMAISADRLIGEM